MGANCKLAPILRFCELDFRTCTGIVMTSTEWIATLRLIPEADQGKLVIVLSNGTELCVDSLYRYEANFLVLRGRTGGTIDEARIFRALQSNGLLEN